MIRRSAGIMLALLVLAPVLGYLAGASIAEEVECRRGERCRGTESDDQLDGTPGDDDMRGWAGQDRLIGRAGEDRLFGGDGEDEIYGHTGRDLLVGGGGHGHHDYLSGGPGADELRDGDNYDYLSGEDGNDVLRGGDAHQLLRGGAGDDTLYGGRGWEIFIFADGWGHDLIVDPPHYRTDLHMADEVTVDLRVNLHSSGRRAEVTTPDGTATINWANDAIRRIFSGTGDDVIHGNEFVNVIFAHAGGTDIVYAGAGNDFVNVGERDQTHDVVHCGKGKRDRVVYNPEHDTVKGCEIKNP